MIVNQFTIEREIMNDIERQNTIRELEKARDQERKRQADLNNLNQACCANTTLDFSKDCESASSSTPYGYSMQKSFTDGFQYAELQHFKVTLDHMIDSCKMRQDASDYQMRIAIQHMEDALVRIQNRIRVSLPKQYS